MAKQDPTAVQVSKDMFKTFSGTYWALKYLSAGQDGGWVRVKTSTVAEMTGLSEFSAGVHLRRLESRGVIENSGYAAHGVKWLRPKTLVRSGPETMVFASDSNNKKGP